MLNNVIIQFYIDFDFCKILLIRFEFYVFFEIKYQDKIYIRKIEINDK